MIFTGPRLLISLLSLSILALSGCIARQRPPMPPLVAAQIQGEPAPVIEPAIIRGGDGLPMYVDRLEHQLRHEPPIPSPQQKPEMTEPAAVIAYANKRARQAPSLDHYLNAVQRWTYQEGKLYQVYVLPERLTAILLSPDEQLISFLAGDVREEYWLFAHKHYGPEGAVRHVLAVSPQKYGLINNLVILTTQRTYAIELISPDRPKRGSKYENSYMVQVEWSYPAVEEAKRRKALAEAQLKKEEKKAAQLDLSKMHFVYDIYAKTKPRWMPLSAFHDGNKAYIRFPDDLSTMEAPVLYVDAGKAGNQIVNYRYRPESKLYVVDRLFEAAELRVGGKKGEVVEIRLREDRMYESQPAAASVSMDVDPALWGEVH